ncbi:MAG: class IIb bacteriocin, lactobin A/cerein 7B family, partial [Leuconostoc mesenteroides]
MALFKELSNKELVNVNGGVVPVAVVLGVPTLAL